MHWNALVIIPADTEDFNQAVSVLLRPFNKNLEIDLPKEYFHFRIINRWKVHLSTDELATIAEYARKTLLGSEEIGLDERGIYRITTHNSAGHWDSWCYSGGELMFGEERWRHCLEAHNAVAGYGEPITCNICQVENLPNNFRTASVITPNGHWHDIDDFADQAQIDYELTDKQISAWDKHIRKPFNKYSDHLAVGLDFHG